jgi:hypothetical protein
LVSNIIRVWVFGVCVDFVVFLSARLLDKYSVRGRRVDR